MLKGLCTAATLALLTTTWVVAGSEPLPEKAADIRPLLIGARAPEVNVLTASGEELPLRNLVTGQPSILVIYRGAW